MNQSIKRLVIFLFYSGPPSNLEESRKSRPKLSRYAPLHSGKALPPSRTRRPPSCPHCEAGENQQPAGDARGAFETMSNDADAVDAVLGQLDATTANAAALADWVMQTAATCATAADIRAHRHPRQRAAVPFRPDRPDGQPRNGSISPSQHPRFPASLQHAKPRPSEAVRRDAAEPTGRTRGTHDVASGSGTRASGPAVGCHFSAPRAPSKAHPVAARLWRRVVCILE